MNTLGYTEQLREALEDPALNEFVNGTPSPDAKEAAAQVAVALGYCHIFGVEAGDLDGVLPVPEAIAAAEILAQRAERLAELARTLPERWDSAADCVEAESYCMDILRLRMDLWVGMIILGEAEVRADLDGDKDAGLLTRLVENLVERIDEADKAIRQRDTLMLVATVAQTPLVENWRRLLVEPYRSSAPYWLDGTLEKVNEQIERTIKKIVRSLLMR